jgi:hypothetical protein
MWREVITMHTDPARDRRIRCCASLKMAAGTGSGEYGAAEDSD